jgi:protein-disulfide isomerase
MKKSYKFSKDNIFVGVVVIIFAVLLIMSFFIDSIFPTPDIQPQKLIVVNDSIFSRLDQGTNPDAEVNVVVFTDPSCPVCRKLHQTLKKVVEAYPDDVNLLLKHFPVHRGIEVTQSAAECARDQDKFMDVFEGLQTGVKGTPMFFINGRMFKGAQSFSAFKLSIDQELMGVYDVPQEP